MKCTVKERICTDQSADTIHYYLEPNRVYELSIFYSLVQTEYVCFTCKNPPSDRLLLLKQFKEFLKKGIIQIL